LEQFTSYYWYPSCKIFGIVYQLLLILMSDVWNCLPATADTVHVRPLEKLTS
jgi:hypothetical protein